MNGFRLFNAIIVSMLVAGILLVALALTTVKMLDRGVIEAAAGRNRQAEFLLAATVVNRAIVRPHDIRDTTRLKPILDDIQDLRPGIRSLAILELVSGNARQILSTENKIGKQLSAEEIQSVRENKLLSYFEDTGTDRAWVFTAPLHAGDRIIGALHGRFSVSKYDALVQAQEDVAKQVAVAAVIVTCLTMLLLIRLQLHRPIARLLSTMDKVRSGDLRFQAPINGPVEIRRLAEHFNQMMVQLSAAMDEKERLLKAIKHLNGQLEEKVKIAVGELNQERENLAAAQIAAQRNKNLAEIGEISAIMAHELGNPLNALSCRLQLIQKFGMAEETSRHLDAISGHVVRMTDVIQHILKSTRVESISSPVDMNALIRDVLGLIQEPHITFVTQLSGDLPPVRADRTALHGVIMNLITNAIQAMNHRHEVTLTTTIGESDDLEGYVLVRAISGRRMVRFTVKDTGPGIPDAVLHKICDPFFSTRQEAGGTGLGLAICRRSIATAGGQFSVQSVIGSGTVFRVDLPVWLES